MSTMISGTLVSLLALALIACSPAARPIDAGTTDGGGDDAPTSDSAMSVDAAMRDDAASPRDASPDAACTPLTLGCDTTIACPSPNEEPNDVAASATAFGAFVPDVPPAAMPRHVHGLGMPIHDTDFFTFRVEGTAGMPPGAEPRVSVDALPSMTRVGRSTISVALIVTCLHGATSITCYGTQTAAGCFSETDAGTGAVSASVRYNCVGAADNDARVTARIMQTDDDRACMSYDLTLTASYG